jgi:hypothetical protein
MRAAIDSLLQYILRSICIQLAGDSAGGTLWLRDNPQQGLWLRSVVRNGRVLRTKEMRRIRVHRLQLFAHELPDSGQPACCAGHGMKQWLSSDMRAFVSLPMTLEGSILGCFIIWLRPTDASPTPDQMQCAASLTELALLALRVSSRHREPF